MTPSRPRQQPRPAPIAVAPKLEPVKSRPQPKPQYVNVVIPAPDALGISLEPKPQPVVVPSPDVLGIHLD